MRGRRVHGVRLYAEFSGVAEGRVEVVGGRAEVAEVALNLPFPFTPQTFISLIL